MSQAARKIDSHSPVANAMSDKSGPKILAQDLQVRYIALKNVRITTDYGSGNALSIIIVTGLSLYSKFGAVRKSHGELGNGSPLHGNPAASRQEALVHTVEWISERYDGWLGGGRSEWKTTPTATDITAQDIEVQRAGNRLQAK